MPFNSMVLRIVYILLITLQVLHDLADTYLAPAAEERRRRKRENDVEGMLSLSLSLSLSHSNVLCPLRFSLGVCEGHIIMPCDSLTV